MPDTFTTNLALTQPEVGSSADTWGAKLNTDLAVLDALFAASGAGTIVTRDASNFAAVQGINISKGAGLLRPLQFNTISGGGPKLRWLLGADPTAESGANAGSLFVLQRTADDGTTFLGTSVSVNRATGQVTFETTPQVGSNQVYHQGNSGPLTASLPPIGTVSPYVGGVDPAGGTWLLMDGRAISRTTYAGLFTLIGTAYGVGDGVTTFNIPNAAERVIVGHSATQTLITQYDCRVLGGAVGEGKHTMLLAEIASHNHPVFLNDPGHSHTSSEQSTTNAPSTTTAFGQVSPGNTGTSTTGVTVRDTAGGGGTANQTATAGSATPFNVVQPGLVLNYIIRVL